MVLNRLNMSHVYFVAHVLIDKRVVEVVEIGEIFRDYLVVQMLIRRRGIVSRLLVGPNLRNHGIGLKVMQQMQSEVLINREPVIYVWLELDRA